jgi:biopolymer transport protein ExbD
MHFKFLFLGMLTISCTTSVEGLWVTQNNEALLKFSKDSVINNSRFMNGKLGFNISKDSITWLGINPEWNHGKTKNTFLYLLTKDSLVIWYDRENPSVYYKSMENNLHDHILKQSELNLDLPEANNSSVFPRHNIYFDIKIGIRNQKEIIYFQDKEVITFQVGNEIKKIIMNDSLNVILNEPACRLFADKKIRNNTISQIYDQLRKNNIRVIYLINKNTSTNVYFDDFKGIRFLLQ